MNIIDNLEMSGFRMVVMGGEYMIAMDLSVTRKSIEVSQANILGDFTANGLGEMEWQMVEEVESREGF